MGPINSEMVIKGMITARSKYKYYKLVNDIVMFSKIWSVVGVLCKTGENEMLILNLQKCFFGGVIVCFCKNYCILRKKNHLIKILLSPSLSLFIYI